MTPISPEKTVANARYLTRSGTWQINQLRRASTITWTGDSAGCILAHLDKGSTAVVAKRN